MKIPLGYDLSVRVPMSYFIFYGNATYSVNGYCRVAFFSLYKASFVAYMGTLRANNVNRVEMGAVFSNIL